MSAASEPPPGFAYRLPADVAARIRETADAEAPPLLTTGSPRRRLIVLLLALVLLGGGMAMTLPGGAAQGLRSPDCAGWTVDAVGHDSADQDVHC